jgi:oxalate decarboxylase/phosphoglucose isomerase-like protein (cupin superfamily)
MRRRSDDAPARTPKRGAAIPLAGARETRKSVGRIDLPAAGLTRSLNRPMVATGYERDEKMTFASTPELQKLHEESEAAIKGYSYKKPESVERGKGFIRLALSPLIKGTVQIVKKNGGENNLHYHTSVDTFWMVLKGKVKFYGPEDVLIGEYGLHEGLITPRFSRYWFENSGDEDLELLQVAANDKPNLKSGGRTDVSEQRYKLGEGPVFDASKEKSKV